MAEAVPNQQLLCVREMAVGNWHDLPEARGNVGEKPPTDQMKTGGSNLARADQTGEYGMQFDDTESGNEVIRACLGEEGIDGRGAYFDAVMFGCGAGVKEAVGHPSPFASAFFTLGMNQLGKRAGGLSENVAHGFEAYRSIGGREPVR